jgi:hypothetical protein
VNSQLPIPGHFTPEGNPLYPPNNIQVGLKESGCDSIDSFHVFQDRDRWASVSTLTNAAVQL